MKGPLLPLLVIAIVLGGAYYYLYVMKKPVPEKLEEKPSEKKEPERLIGNMYQPNHSSEAIASMFSGDQWRKDHPILI